MAGKPAWGQNWFMSTVKSAAAKPAAKPAAKAAPKTAAAKAAPAAKPAIKKPVAKVAPPIVATEGSPKRYRMLTGIDDSAFCQKVSDALDDGYELYGSPTMTFNGSNVIVGQAVVLKKKHKKGKRK